jgi:hypothetical protein
MKMQFKRSRSHRVSQKGDDAEKISHKQSEWELWRGMRMLNSFATNYMSKLIHIPRGVNVMAVTLLKRAGVDDIVLSKHTTSTKYRDHKWVNGRGYARGRYVTVTRTRKEVQYKLDGKMMGCWSHGHGTLRRYYDKGYRAVRIEYLA